MLAFSWFAWWYGRGWVQAVQQVEQILAGISRLFSVPILLRTLAAPWKRIITYPGASLDAKIHAFLDNLVSRAIGMTVRLLVLLTALLFEAIALVVGVVYVIVWPFLPLAVISLLVKGILG